MLHELLRALPNVVSLSRLVMAGWFLATDDPLVRALLVAAAAASDALDGWLARLTGVASRAGALIDPLADRTFAILAVSALLFDGVLTTPQYFILLARDIMTMVGFLVARVMPTLREVPFQARPLGKAVTVLQFFSLFVALARPAWAATFVYLAGLAALASIVDYTLLLVRARRAVLAGGRPPSAGASALVLLLLVPAATTAAQGVPAPWPELRAAVSDPAAAELGLGLSWQGGAYLRVLPMLALGAARDGDVWRGTARGELTVRFSPDPFAQQRWAPYAAAGLAVGCRRETVCVPTVVARLGIEGPLVGSRWRPAFEVGVGGGVQLAVAWRRGRYGRR